MRYRAEAIHRGARAGLPRAGFTLIELLTVIAIIGLLVSMVVPTLRSIFIAQNRVSTRVRIANLDNGVQVYRMEQTGNKYFPGQYPYRLKMKNEDFTRKASSYLARCLFTDPNDLFPTGAYATYEEDMLDDEDGTLTGVPYTILDTYPDHMPIVYYVAKKGMVGPTRFDLTDNDDYLTNENMPNRDKFLEVIKNGKGDFLLLAPGKDRYYSERENIRNWK
jgi:prepilin-type N-terminal cleavage/methylation domain-containing protein